MEKILPTPKLFSALKSLILLPFIILASVVSLKAQAVYKLSNSKDNVLKISGKSNIHDWAMTAESLQCEADFSPINSDDGIPKKLLSLHFSVNAKSLKSESESMNNRTYKTIKAEVYPQITFKLREAVITPLQKNKFSVNATGTLTIAGVSKVITLQVNGDVKPDNSILCSGKEEIKLTDYNIKPPSFMLGAMKVGNELTITYTFQFKK